MALVISSRSPRELGTSPWAVTETVLQIILHPCPTEGFRTFLLVGASSVACRAQCKMKMQSPLLKNYQEGRNGDSLALSRYEALLSGPTSGVLHLSSFTKLSVTAPKLSHCAWSFPGCLPCFPVLFCFSPPLMCFVSFSRFLVVKVTHTFYGRFLSGNSFTEA